MSLLTIIYKYIKRYLSEFGLCQKTPSSTCRIQEEESTFGDTFFSFYIGDVELLFHSTMQNLTIYMLFVKILTIILSIIVIGASFRTLN